MPKPSTRIAAAVLGAIVMAVDANGAGTAEKPLYGGLVEDFQGKSPAQQLQLIVDREEIRDLIATYAHRLTNGGTSAADMFTDDGAFLTRDASGRLTSEIRGRAAINKFYGDLALTPRIALPMIHNHLISIDGDQGRGVISIEVRITADGVSRIGSGYYNDTYRRENGRWRFVTRDITLFHDVPLSQGWAEQPPEQ